MTEQEFLAEDLIKDVESMAVYKKTENTRMRATAKKRAQIIHAKKRMKQRKGIKLNRKSYAELVKKIQRGDGVFLKRQSKRITHWLLRHSGLYIKCVYDSKRKTIVTILL